MKPADLITRTDHLIAAADAAMNSTHVANGMEWVNGGPMSEFRSASLSFIRQTFGEEHPYYTEFEKVTKGHVLSCVEKGRGILLAARAEIAGGWLQSTRSLLAADIFGDFLEMADYLLQEKYKDPAAVIIGSVLEEHLRQLATANAVDITYPKNGKDVPKKADVLNSDLAKAKVYGTLDHKNITAWLDLRNKAAHGRYQEYTHEEVKLLLEGVRNFVVRVPV